MSASKSTLPGPYLPVQGACGAFDQILQQIADAQDTSFIIKDLEHRFIRVSARVADALGRPAEQLIGLNDLQVGLCEKLVLGDPDTGWPGFWALDDAAIATGGTTRTDESNISFGKRQIRALYTLRTPLLNEAGEPVALLVQSRDTSRENEIDQRMRSSQHALTEREADFETLDAIMAALLRWRDVDSLLEQITRTVIERTCADGACLSIPNETEDYLECVAAAGPLGESLAGIRQAFDEGLIGQAWSTARPAFVDDADAHGSLHRFGQRVQVGCLPLSIDGKVAGVLAVTLADDHIRLEAHRLQLERIVRLASLAISNARLAESTTRSLASTRALAEISRHLGTIDDSDEACNLVCRMLPEALDATYSNCYLFDGQRVLRQSARWVLTRDGPQSLPLGDNELSRVSIASWVAENGQAATIGRDDIDPRESDRPRELRRQLDIGSSACVPLFRDGRSIGVMVVARTRDRSDFDDVASGTINAVGNQLSMALDRHALSCELHHQAYHDPLTGLPNRRRLEQELAQALESAARPASTDRFAVLFLDLDGFKHVNDTLGHAVGDRLLVCVAKRFRHCLRESDRLARLGGDEFAVVVHQRHPDDALAIAARLSAALVEPIVLDGSRLHISTSIGVSRYPDDGIDIDELLRHADTAMYQAKRTEGNSVRCFDAALASDARQRTALAQELRSAIATEQLQLHYQSQVCCQSGQVVGIEALVRWYHPQRGIVPPDSFIPLAEETGMIDSIGDHVLDDAVRLIASHVDSPIDGLRIAVNIGASQFQQPRFASDVLERLADHGVAAKRLELEVTESVVMHDVGNVVDQLQSLRDAGVRIAIDDFGTGYSSLSYLQDLPLDVLKIDRAFVGRIGADNADQSLVRTIQLLAMGLGLRTVAEGVETREQRDAIARLGCDMIQGYYYSRPVPADELEQAIRNINGDTAMNRAA